MNYLKCYYNMINHALHEKRKRGDEYYESHHVKPKCKGGSFEVLLTAREHFISHLLLTKIYKNDYQMCSAFNKMFCSSDNQERYLPKSHWYEYKRKEFSKNHPVKQEHIKDKIRRKLKANYFEKCKVTRFVNCKNCGKLIIGSPKQFCSKKCRWSERNKESEIVFKDKCKPCIICGKMHTGKYCCSKNCFEKYSKIPNNLYSKTLSTSRSKYIKENNEKVKIAAQKSADSVNQINKGEKISETKKRNKSGNNNAKSKPIFIYNEKRELIYESYGNFKLFCDKNKLPYIRCQHSYRRNKPMTKEYKGWIVTLKKEG